MNDKDLIIELLQEEIAKLSFFIERHHRWGKLSDNKDIAYLHHSTVNYLKEAANSNYEIINQIKELP